MAWDQDIKSEITVRIANNYGKRVVYPVCQCAHTFAELAGTATLTDRTISLIKSLGYTIDVQQETL
jgi:hypothetical protein